MSVTRVKEYLRRWNRHGDVLEMDISTATVPLAAAALGVEVGTFPHRLEMIDEAEHHVHGTVGHLGRTTAQILAQPQMHIALAHVANDQDGGCGGEQQCEQGDENDDAHLRTPLCGDALCATVLCGASLCETVFMPSPWRP